MKKWFTKALAFVLAVTLAWVPVGDMGSVRAASDTVVTGLDAELSRAFCKQLNKAEGSALTEGEIATITYLDTYYYDIQDYSGLNYCTGMTWLKLADDEDVDMSFLANMPSLTTLELRTPLNGDLSILGTCTNLEKLYIDANSTCSDLSVISNLVNLEELTIRYANITSMPDLSALTGLQTLSVGRCNSLTSNAAMGTCSNLETVEFTYCDALADVSGLSGSNKLVDVSFSICSEITDISVLKGKTGITSLKLDSVDKAYTDNTTAFEETIASLVNLQFLNVAYCDIEDESIFMLAPLTKLETLILNYNNLSDNSFLLNHKDTLKCVMMYGNYGASNPNVYAQLTNLTELGVSRTGTSDYSFISSLPNLTKQYERQTEWRPTTNSTIVYEAFQPGTSVTVTNPVKNDKGEAVAPLESEYYTYDAATNTITFPASSYNSSFGYFEQAKYAWSMTSRTGDTLEVEHTLQVDALGITEQPQSQTVNEGYGFSLSVKVSNGNRARTYEWYKDGVLIEGANTSKITVPESALSDAGTYQVVISTTFEGKLATPVSVTSEEVTVTVIPDITPLAILTQPKNTAIVEGKSGSLTVAAEGEGTLSYQWYKDGTPISGATSATYNISNMTADKAGTYKVVVTDSLTSVTSNEVSVTMEKALKITSQPTGLTLFEGESGSLSVTAVGEGTLSYQWYHNGSKLTNGKTVTLRLSDIQHSQEGSYYVVVTDKNGSVTSSTVMVNVEEELEITTQPTAIAKLEGESGSLSVNAIGEGTLTYQWYKDGVAITGANGVNLEFEQLAQSDEGKYKVVVTDTNSSITSNEVTVTVYQNINITKQPTGFTVVEGAAKNLTVEAEGEGTLSYQWYKNDAILTGKTDATLAFSSITLSDAGEYKVVITDDIGTVTSNAVTVTVHNKLEITKQPVGFTKVEGEAGSLTVEAEGEGTLSYQWYKDNTKVEGATSATLSFASLAETDEGSYSVEVRDVNGKVTSTAVNVVVYNKLEITKQPTGFTMVEGNKASLAVEADGEGTLTYQWYKDGAKLEGATKATISFASLALANAGEYKVVVTDSTGSSLTSDVVTVAVHNKLEITTQPTGINLIEGKSGSLTVVAEGEGTLSYQWYKGESAIEGATSATLRFDSIAMLDAGSYTVKVSDLNGTVTSTAVAVVVYDQLAIIKQPTGITLVEGNAGSLTVEAMGEGALAYQWYKDGVKLNGANASTLNFAAITMTDAGSYIVEVSDSIGSKVTSNVAAVVVQNALEITKQPAGITLVEGNAGSLTVEAEGEGTLSYQWYKGENAIEGATSTSLSFSNIAMTDAGSYTVKVSDANGSITSTAATIVVQNALEITKQPANLTLIEGNTGSLTVEAEGEGTLKYQWYKGDEALNGETKTTLSFSSIAKADAGKYKVEVTDVNGSVTSTPVTVTVQTALKITTQPTGISLLVGENGTLTVAAVGEGTLSYQWYKGDAEISGATTAALELKNVTEADEAAYTVKVTDQNGSIISNAANVVVDKHLKITKQPGALDVLVGSTASLTVEAEGEGTLTYQWYKGDTAVEGATNTTLSWENISLSDAGTYKVVVTDKNGSVNSNEVAIEVDKRLAITKQPMGITLVEGNSGSLTVEAEGAGTLKYQWYKGDEAVAGANKASFTLDTVEKADAGTYKVEVSDDNGKVVSTAVTVTVQNALEITKQPAGLTLIEGKSGSLTVEAEGEGELSYQWYKDGVAIVTPAVFALNGAGSATLELTNVTLGDAGTYKVVITDSNGSVTSSEAVVVVEKKLAITKQQLSLSIIEGQSGILTVDAVGAGAMTYQWYKNDVIVDGANSAVYALNNAQLTDAGQYKVVITDKNGTITSNAITVTVQNALKIVKQPEGFTLKTGQSGTLQILATGEGILTYQWYKNGVAMEGATSSSLNLANLNLADAGEYKVVVSDANSSLSSEAVIVIVEAVVVYEEPAEEPAPAPAQTPAPVAIAPKTGETAAPVAVAAMAVLTLLGAVIMRKKKSRCK